MKTEEKQDENSSPAIGIRDMYQAPKTWLLYQIWIKPAMGSLHYKKDFYAGRKTSRSTILALCQNLFTLYKAPIVLTIPNLKQFVQRFYTPRQMSKLQEKHV